MKTKRKGFTIIELIVVMAIIAILVLFAAPKFLNYVKDARETNVKVEVKELENALTTYSLRNNELPSLSGETFNAEQVKGFSEEIYDKVGKVKEILEGDYYNIDYNKIQKYLKEPKDGSKYILHASGKVYYLGNEASDSEIIYSPEDYFIVDENGIIVAISYAHEGTGTTEFVIPHVINGIKVRSIGEYAFGYLSNITKIVLPEGVISIAKYAFFNDEALKEVVIPEGVTSIGYASFNTNSALEVVKLPVSLINIGDFAFSGCPKLSSIEIPTGVTNIGNYAFGSWTSDQTIILNGIGQTLGTNWSGGATVIYK